MKNAPDWVKSVNIGANPILNQFRSRHKPSSSVCTVYHCPLSPQENRLWSVFHEKNERDMHPPPSSSSAGSDLNSIMALEQTRTIVVRQTPMNMSTGYSTCAAN